MENRKIRRVYLNNKSRKGWYWYVKEKGLPNRYYKLDEQVPFDAINEYYTRKYVTKKDTHKVSDVKRVFKQNKKSKADKKIIEKYSKFIKKRKSLKSNIKRGLGIGKIDDVLSSGLEHVKKSYKDMLTGLVLDERLINIMTSEENMQKIKAHLEHRIILKDSNNKELGNANIVAKKTTKEVFEDIININKKGEKIQGFSPNIKIKFVNKGYEYNQLQDGTLYKIEIISILRKG